MRLPGGFGGPHILEMQHAQPIAVAIHRGRAVKERIGGPAQIQLQLQLRHVLQQKIEDALPVGFPQIHVVVVQQKMNALIPEGPDRAPQHGKLLCRLRDAVGHDGQHVVLQGVFLRKGESGIDLVLRKAAEQMGAFDPEAVRAQLLDLFLRFRRRPDAAEAVRKFHAEPDQRAHAGLFPRKEDAGLRRGDAVLLQDPEGLPESGLEEAAHTVSVYAEDHIFTPPYALKLLSLCRCRRGPRALGLARQALRSRQIEGQKIKGTALALHGEVKRFLFAEAGGHGAGEALADGAGLHRDAQDRLAVLPGAHRDEAAVPVALEIHGDGLGFPQVEVLEAHRAAGAEVGHILVGPLFPILALLGQERIELPGVLEHGQKAGAVFTVDVAGNVGRIVADALERRAVEPAGAHFRLMEFAVLKADLLGAGLAGRLLAVGVAVIEDVVFPADLDEAAVGVAGAHARVLHIRDAGEPDIAAGDKNAAVFEAVIGEIGDGVAEVVAVERAVDEIIFAVEFAHGAGLAEGLRLEGRALGLLAGQHADILQLVAGNDGQHVLGVDLEDHRPLFRRLGAVEQDRIAAEGEAGVEVKPTVVVLQAAGVELEGLVPLADGRAVLILDIAVKLILSGGLVADGHGDHLGAAHEVIEVIAPVVAHHHVRRGQTVGHAQLRRGGILLTPEDDAVVSPVAQIVHRRRPADVVAQAEVDAVEEIVRAVDIDPAVHDMGLGVGHVFPARQIGVEGLLGFHTRYLRSYFVS